MCWQFDQNWNARFNIEFCLGVRMLENWFHISFLVIIAWKSGICRKKGKKEAAGFPEGFAAFFATKGPNPTPFIGDDSGHYLCSLPLWGNPKWGTSRDQWNSALNYLIYWSSSKTLKTQRARYAHEAFSTNLRAQQPNKNTTILFWEKLPHL